MSKKIFTRLFITILFVFCLAPSTVFAAKITNTTLWSSYGNNSGNLGYAQVYYYTKGLNHQRESKYIPSFYDNDNSKYVFCIEPGATFKSNTSISGYSIGSSKPKLPNGWSIKEDELKKVLSCWNSEYAEGNNASVVAEQILVWELVTGERYNINATKILGGDYAPYQSNGTRYLASDSSKKTLYDLVSARSTVYNAYKAILRCAARFNITPPSWATSTTTKGANKQELTSYNDNTQVFSRTFAHGSKLEPNLFKYYTFQINGKNADCKKGATVDNVTCSCDNTKCTFSTNKEISSSNPVKITFNYTYKDNVSFRLNSFSDKYNTTNYYTKSGYQSLMTGSASKSFYLNIYTDKKPKYQLKVTKKDTAGNPVSGIKFNVYSDSKATKKIGETTATDAKGVATYKEIPKIGTYYLKEANNKDGFITNNKIVTVKVDASHKVGTNSYSLATFTNDYMHLVMNKRTKDANGKIVTLKGDSCSVKTCPNENNRENGPIFEITKAGKKVCVSEKTSGNYKLVSIASTCPDGSDNKIKTCNGKFDIEGITSGTYTVTEIATVCGMTLPSNPTKTVTVKANTKTTTITMDNGISGVVFNKLSENGDLLDGGKYALQKKENGVYKDILLKKVSDGVYNYADNLVDGKDGATYILETSEGSINVNGLPVGEYRFVEKQAPEGYAAIKDKDSTAIFTISDKAKEDYYQVNLINQKIKTEGSYDTAELIITIITGRKVLNYVLIFGGLIVLLVALIIIRKKLKK